MKKILFSLGVMLSAFALTNCTQEIENPAQQPESAGYPFEIVASTVDTKTVNDGMSTKWAAGDQINLFHAVTNGNDYKSNGAFVINDVEAGSFNGNLCEELNVEEEYDWYAFYPYSSYIATPANTSKGFMPVGCQANEAQIQIRNNNKDHIAGANYPMTGRAIAVAAGSTPKIKMSHASSLLEIVVTNTVDTPLKVTDITFEAPTDIVGTYYIDFSGDITPESFVGSGDGYVSNVASLTVKDGEELTNGQSARFYLAVKPFTVSGEDELTITVNGYEKILTVANDVTFQAGKIKTLTVSYAAKDASKRATLTFDDKAKRKEFDNNHQVWTENGITFTNNKGGSTSNVGDYSKPIRLYKSSDIIISAPGNITMLQFNCQGIDNKYVTALSSLEGAELENGFVTIVLDGTSNTVTYPTLSAQARVNSLIVTYVEGVGGETPETKVLESIAVSEATVSYNVGDDFVKPAVIATYSDDTTADVTESAAFSGYDMSTAGTQTVTVSYTEDEITVTTEYDITVNAVEVEMITTTIEDFLAITEENANIYTVTGKIVNIEEISSQYKNATLTIADDNGNELYIYRMKAAEGGEALENLGLTLGDILTVSGKWGIHGGTVQLVSGVYVNHEDKEAIEQEGAKVVTIAEFLKEPVSTVTKYRLTGEIVLLEPFNTQYNNVNLTIADETGEVYVYRLTGPEGTTIDALGLTVGDILTVEGNRGVYNENPQLTNAVYISHEDVEVEEPEIPAGTTEVELVFANCGFTNSQSVNNKEIALDENVKVVFAQGKAGTAPAYYTSGSAVRLYQNGATMDVTANGKTITKIELTFASNQYFIAPDCGTLSAEATVRTWTGDATAVKFTTTGTDKSHRAYIAKIKVSYSE